MIVKVAETLTEFTKAIESPPVLPADATDEPPPDKPVFWFRGHGLDSYKLKPSLYRHPKISDVSSLIELEWGLIKQFKARSVPYIPYNYRGDDYDMLHTMFVMQHYGVPTRLLDWTENPFIALFFALSDSNEKRPPDNEDDSVVWMLDPVKWNQSSLENDAEPGIITIPDSRANGYRPVESFTRFRKNNPVAITGTHNSPRIVAQRGTFTIFGKRSDPMEHLFVEKNWDDSMLVKIKIPYSKSDTLLIELMNRGFTDATVYPDLVGLSSELRRKAGF